MEAVFPVAALRDRPREVKQAACQGLVRITENGDGAYIFCSEEVFRHEMDDARESALYEARATHALEQGLADIDAGRYVVGIDTAKQAVAQMRLRRGRAGICRVLLGGGFGAATVC